MTQPAVSDSAALIRIPLPSLGHSRRSPARPADALLPVDRRPSQVAAAFATAHRLSAELELTLGKLNGTRQLNGVLRQELQTTRRLARSLRAQSATLRTDHHRTSEPNTQPRNDTGNASSHRSEDRPGRLVSAAIGASRRLSVDRAAPHDPRPRPAAVGATPPRSIVAPALRAPLMTRPLTAHADRVR